MDSGSRTGDDAETLLLETARTHGIDVRKDDVQRTLRDSEHGPFLAAWADVHLAYDHLLSPDELALYTALDQSGEVDRLAALHDLAEVQAVSEDDMRRAVAELQLSTETIAKQTETLRQQHDALSRLVKKQGDNDARRREMSLSRQRRAETDKRHIAAEVEELAQDIKLRISEIEQRDSNAGPGLKENLDNVFGSDDKLLASLQKLGWELDQPDPAETQSVEQLREICMRLIKITVETVRTRLDTTYLDTLLVAERSGQANPATTDEVTALQEEVDSLYSEILPVAQMSVEQQHLEPALKSVNARGGQSAQRTAAALTYVNECLDYLLERTDRLRTRIGTQQSHQAAADSLVETAKAEITAPVSVDKPANATTADANISPVRTRSKRTNGHSRRRSSGIMEEPPLKSLFQSLSLSPAAFDDGGTVKEQVKALSKILQERTQKRDEVARSAQQNFEASAAAYLMDAKGAIQLLHDSVLAETAFGQVQLADQELESSISVLAQEAEKAKEKLDTVEGQRGGGSSEKREEIIRRWG